MAYDEDLVERIRRHFAGRTDVSERKMFGGLAFMVGGHMCCGVLQRMFIARVGPEAYARTLTLAHVRPMDFTGRPLTGLVYVAPPGTATTRALNAWIRRCEQFTGHLRAQPARRRARTRRAPRRSAQRRRR